MEIQWVVARTAGGIHCGRYAGFQHPSIGANSRRYIIADIGINTCDGEGFGLCNFEQAGIGIPSKWFPVWAGLSTFSMMSVQF